MNQTAYFRLLPRGATILSGALTWLAVAATDTYNEYLSINTTNYATPIQSPHAPVGALLAQRDACLGDCRDTPHPQHATEVPHYGAAEPRPALSRTHAPAFRPAHPGELRLPLPPAQRRREGRQQLPASGGPVSTGPSATPAASRSPACSSRG